MKDIERIRNKISRIWNHTELEMSDLSRTGLQKELSAISKIVNNVMGDLDNITTCSMCSKQVCVSCINNMANELDV